MSHILKRMLFMHPKVYKFKVAWNALCYLGPFIQKVICIHLKETQKSNAFKDFWNCYSWRVLRIIYSTVIPSGLAVNLGKK